MNIDILLQVRKRLEADTGNLRRVADESGVSYDTVLRIKNGEGDPGYSKVQTLADYYLAQDLSIRRSVAAST